MNCTYCSNKIPPFASLCCHCGRPSLFPNVEIAQKESLELQARYDKVVNDSLVNGTFINLSDFEKALENTQAVMNRYVTSLNQLSADEDGVTVYDTYYQLSQGIRLQMDEEFDSSRQAADSIFFTGYREKIIFAALSLDSNGLSNYGDCTWILREELIKHRTSLFEDNTTLYYIKKPDIRASKDIPKGYRAVWADRAKLCVSKLSKKISITTTSADYPSILLHQGATSADDECVEVHIYGQMTILTIKEVTFNPVPTTMDKKSYKIRIAEIEGAKERLNNHGVKIN